MECPPRFATARSPERQTLGKVAERIALELGKPLLPWQKLVLDVALEIEDGKPAYREVIVTVPRQQGKTTLLLCLMLTRALAEKSNIRFTAQTGAAARSKLVDDWLPELNNSKFVSLYDVRLAKGEESLRFSNGSLLALVPTTVKAGHGQVIDLACLDEAFAHSDWRLEQALKPAMATRPYAQFWIISTAGTQEMSPYLWSKVETGRQFVQQGLNHSIAYFEWSAQDDADLYDPDTWRACMPALGYTISEEVIRSDIASIDNPNEARRAYLNLWTTAVNDHVIDLEAWKRLEDPRSYVNNSLTLAVDVTPDRSWSAIAVAGKRNDGLWHLEVIDHRRGTAWVIERLQQLFQKHDIRCVIYDPSSPAASLASALHDLPIRVITISAREHAQACGMFFDAVTEGTLRHLGTHELLAALDGASKRPLGDSWAWSRKSSAVDISPLVAVTLAHWGSKTQDQGPPEVWSVAEVLREIQEERGETPQKASPVTFIPA